MLKRPSSRRKSESQEVTINLVPMLDALVTMVAFLLYSMSFFAFVSIESPVPITSTRINDEKLKEKPVQLTVSIRQTEIEVWSPFKRFAAVKIANLPDGAPDVEQLHKNMIDLKQKFPNETKVIMVPNIGTTYDTLVAVMDASRTLEATDPPLFLRNAQTGVDEQVKALFPEVVFGNLLGDS